MKSHKPKTICEIIAHLDSFWLSNECIVLFSSDIEVGAGTLHPQGCFFPSLHQQACRIAFSQACRRPGDSRLAKSKNRLQRFIQYQTLLIPPPIDGLELFLQSLNALGFDINSNEVRFFKDDWHSPVIGAAGIGWEVRINGIEIAQITYFQTMGGIKLQEPALEITYGIERIAMLLQKAKNMKLLKYNKDTAYTKLISRYEREHGLYALNASSKPYGAPTWKTLYDIYSVEAHNLIKARLWLPAYECLIKMSHLFNMQDASGSISQASKAQTILQIRSLANAIAQKIAPKNLPSIQHDPILNCEPLDELITCSQSLLRIEMKLEPIAGIVINTLQGRLARAFKSWLEQQFVHSRDAFAIVSKDSISMRATVCLSDPMYKSNISNNIETFITTLLDGMSVGYQRLLWDRRQTIHFIVPIRSYSISINSTQISIPAFSTYMQHNNVLVTDTEQSCKQRFLSVQQQIAALEVELCITTIANTTYIETLSNDTKTPRVICCSFNKKFLTLPEPIIKATIMEHIYGIPTYDSHGNMSHMFFYIADVINPKINNIKASLSSEINNRLDDARFFLNRDASTSMDALYLRLDKIEFATNAGTFLHKTHRMGHLWQHFIEPLKCHHHDLDANNIEQIVLMSKLDLGTYAIHEYPDCQGHIIGYLLKQHDVSAAIIQGVTEHLLPKTIADDMPKTTSGSITSLIDKVDTLVTMWLTMINTPSSRGDPYGLKRIGIGIIRICIQEQFDVDISKLISEYAAFVAQLDHIVLSDNSFDSLVESLLCFVNQRLEFVLTNSLPKRTKIIQSCIRGHNNINPIRAFRTASDIINLPEKIRAKLLNTIKRAYNLIKHHTDIHYDSESVVSIHSLITIANEIDIFLNSEKIFEGTQNQIDQKIDMIHTFLIKCFSCFDFIPLI